MEDTQQTLSAEEFTLNLLLDRSERSCLLSAIREIFLDHGCGFSDVCQALADYADSKRSEFSHESQTWQVVGLFLESAARALKPIDAANNSPRAALGSYAVRQRLVRSTRLLAKTIGLRGYHFSTLMLAMADYAESKVVTSQEGLTWLQVKSFLVDAAIEAEARGRELP